MSRKMIQGELTPGWIQSGIEEEEEGLEVGVIGSKMIAKDACQNQDGMKTGFVKFSRDKKEISKT